MADMLGNYLSARMTDGKRAPHRGNFDGAAAWGNDLDSNPDGTLEALRLVQCTGEGILSVLKGKQAEIFLFPLSFIIVALLNITKKGPNHTEKGKFRRQVSHFRD
jgi:hypothetical protein